jgi:hypothetical protein
MIKKVLIISVLLSLFVVGNAIAGKMTVPNKNGNIIGFDQGGVPTVTLSPGAIATIRCYPHNTNYPLPVQGRLSRPLNSCKVGGRHRLTVINSNGKGNITITW